MFKPSTLRVCQRQIQRQGATKIALRTLSSTASLYKSKSPKQSPRTKQANKPNQDPKTTIGSNIGNSAPELEQASLPSVAILESARLSRVLTISTEKTLSFLQDFLSLGPSPSLNYVESLLNKYEFQASMLSEIGRIMARCPTTNQRLLGKQLLFSGSSLNEPTCTLEIMSTAIKYDSLTRAEIKSPMKRLLELANSGLLEAQVLQGRVADKQGSFEEAVKWFRLATTSTQASEPLIFGASQHDAFVSLGNLLKSSSPEEAREIFMKAALEYDNPEAYYHLAQMEDLFTGNREIYLLKAASSGVLEASHELGMLYYKKAMGKEKGSEMDEGVAIAKEWFLIAADGGNGNSMLKLGLIYGHEGDVRTLNGWVNRAASMKGMKDQAETLMAKLEQPDFDFVKEILA